MFNVVLEPIHQGVNNNNPATDIRLAFRVDRRIKAEFVWAYADFTAIPPRESLVTI